MAESALPRRLSRPGVSVWQQAGAWWRQIWTPRIDRDKDQW
jgi:hypothetical protein